eukprot:NODE_7122_length_808_cov_31.538686_g6516_i0.p1 GENE.NODE_7122_length_808_cov_31.538686_g6516_i0~~NODE_7122_length_808_cov_31.538686_g6516_i0.p1  ORF type:complete len:188 (-),score=24.41 NODE_7122_length_808_cov_31.538686_g6516_i0:243-737(-)
MMLGFADLSCQTTSSLIISVVVIYLLAVLILKPLRSRVTMSLNIGRLLCFLLIVILLVYVPSTHYGTFSIIAQSIDVLLVIIGSVWKITLLVYHENVTSNNLEAEISRSQVSPRSILSADFTSISIDSKYKNRILSDADVTLDLTESIDMSDISSKSSTYPLSN